MEGFNLGQFLDEQREAGAQDSEGTFTVAQAKALDKMARFSLPGEYDWVLKIVQAVNAWECGFLQVGQSRVATSFYFRPPAESLPSDGELISALKLGSTDRDGAVHELCIALRALVDQVGLSFVLATRKGKDTGSPIFFGDDVRGLSDRIRTQWAELKRPGIRLTVSHFKGTESFTGRYVPTFSGVTARSVEIARVLAQKAYCSPVPIYLDGRDLTNPFCDNEIGQTQYHRPIALGTITDGEIRLDTYPVLANLTDLSRPAVLGTEGAPWCWVKSLDHLALLEHRKAAIARDVNQDLDYFNQYRHQVIWVRRGVLVKRSAWPSSTSGTSIRIFVNADQARTDLTGLSVQLEDDQMRHADNLKMLIREAVPSLYAQVSEMASTTGLRGTFAFEDKHPKPKEVDDIEAGFSVFTEGLGKLGSGSSEFMQGLKRGWRNLVTRGQRNQLLEDWKRFMHREIDQLYIDLIPESMDTDSE